MSNNWMDIAREALKLPGIMVKIYDDAFSPGVQQVGKALETTVGLSNTLLLPIALLNIKANNVLRANMESYRVALSGVSPDDVVSVVPELGVPVLEKCPMYQTRLYLHCMFNFYPKHQLSSRWGWRILDL